MAVTESAPIPFPADAHRAALVARLAALRHDLDAETAARAGAESEADEARELVRDLRRRVAGLEAENGALRKLLGLRLMQGAWPFALAGLASGFLAVLAVRWVGW
jgi:DNA transposition AAA+ family ATPase